MSEQEKTALRALVKAWRDYEAIFGKGVTDDFNIEWNSFILWLDNNTRSQHES